jgi:hypothetical protein
MVTIIKSKDFIEFNLNKQEVDCVIEALDTYYNKLLEDFLNTKDIKQKEDVNKKLYIIEDLINEISLI